MEQCRVLVHGVHSSCADVAKAAVVTPSPDKASRAKRATPEPKSQRGETRSEDKCLSLSSTSRPAWIVQSPLLSKQTQLLYRVVPERFG